jgi:hypothetical protein
MPAARPLRCGPGASDSVPSTGRPSTVPRALTVTRTDTVSRAEVSILTVAYAPKTGENQSVTAGARSRTRRTQRRRAGW